MNLLNATKIKKDEKGSVSDPFSSKVMQDQKNETKEFNSFEEVKQNQKDFKEKIEIELDLNKHSIYSLLINCEYLNNLKIKPRKKFLKEDCDQKLILFNNFFIDIFCVENENILVPDNFLLISFIEKFFSKILDKKEIKNYAIYFLNDINIIPRKVIEPSDFILFTNQQNCYLCEYFDFKKMRCKL